MRILIEALNKRRKALKQAKWLRPTLLAMDLILLVVGLVINPVFGFILGLLLIFINEFLSPIVIQTIFLKEVGGELGTTGKLTMKVVRGSKAKKQKRQLKS
jgi:hypothetical protein